MTDPKTPAVEPRGEEQEESLGGRAQRAAEKYIQTLPTDRPGLAIRDFRKGYEQAAKEFMKERDEVRRDRDGVQRQFMALMDGIAQIHGLRGKTQLSECCVHKNCSPLYDEGEKVAECKWQAGVARGFSECADIAEQALARLDPKNPVRLVERGEE